MSGRKLDLGIAVFGGAEKLKRAIDSIKRNSTTDWRLFLIVNEHPDPSAHAAAVQVVEDSTRADQRIHHIPMGGNFGYAGAVNKLMEIAESEYLTYTDSDVDVLSPGWDESMCGLLDRHHEVGMVFPNGGPYAIDRGNYQEIMWGVGFCWTLNRMAMKDTGKFDESLGHQEEADWCMRLRMAGWKCAALPSVRVNHDATSTNSPASIERINAGVIRFVNKWNLAFNGKLFNYHSPNVTRWEDWPPNSLYLEQWWKAKLPTLNDNPEVVTLDSREYDLIRVPRLRNYYRGRII